MFPVEIKDWRILGILEITGLNDEYKTRVGVLTSKKNEVELRLKRKTQDVQSQQRQAKGIGEANTGSP